MPAPDPLVTICIPTFNRAETFLPQALAAACNQTYGNLEILVSDNASADRTSEVVRGQGDPRIKYHRQERNLGAVGNIDFCINNSSGEYTLLLMDDDSIDADFIECCVRGARENPEAGLIRTGARIVDEKGKLVYSAPNMVAGLDFTQFVIAWTEGKTLPFMCSTLFRTRPLQEVGIRSRHRRWDDVMGEFEIAFRYGRVDIPDIKATYCVHPGELTFREGMREWCEDSCELIDLMCRLVPRDEALLRSRLNPYLAVLNYRIAARLEERWPTRVAAALAVYRTFRVPPGIEFFRDFFARMPWFPAVRSMKRFWRIQQSGVP